MHGWFGQEDRREEAEEAAPHGRSASVARRLSHGLPGGMTHVVDTRQRPPRTGALGDGERSSRGPPVRGLGPAGGVSIRDAPLGAAPAKGECRATAVLE